MRDGFIKVAACTPSVRVADIVYNTQQIKNDMDTASKAGCKVIVFPELCITGYTCGDLFLQPLLLNKAMKALREIVDYSNGIDALIMVGCPVRINANLYNCAAVMCNGELLGMIPKEHLPSYSEFGESRYFTSGTNVDELFEDPLYGSDVFAPINPKLLFVCNQVRDLVVGVEVCEDMWVPNGPSIDLALSGATVICNLSASNEVPGKCKHRRDLVAIKSSQLHSSYIYTSSGVGESTSNTVFGGHNLVAEDGQVLVEALPFENKMSITEVDVSKIAAKRTRQTSFVSENNVKSTIYFDLDVEDTKLTRSVDAHPFIPKVDSEYDEIFNIQAYGLARRLEHVHATKAVVGVSGGLDSTLAVLVMAKAFDILGLDKSGIIAISMPGFGTTARTHNNAKSLCEVFSATYKDIPIVDSVRCHFRDIGHDEHVHDVTYENAQARERTQILMDIANQEGCFVVGTGDLSELALGWATYNGDHMSMYAPNASIPKTLVRCLVKHIADSYNNEKLSSVLYDVLDTPVSPELLPANEDDSIAQVTEDLVGPYELHDFVLYHMIVELEEPAKIFRLANIAFEGVYSPETILKWMKKFYWRFFTQQFKRSCMPDGPKASAVSASSMADMAIPSDAFATTWLEQLDEIEY